MDADIAGPQIEIGDVPDHLIEAILTTNVLAGDATSLAAFALTCKRFLAVAACDPVMVAHVAAGLTSEQNLLGLHDASIGRRPQAKSKIQLYPSLDVHHPIAHGVLRVRPCFDDLDSALSLRSIRSKSPSWLRRAPGLEGERRAMLVLGALERSPGATVRAIRAITPAAMMTAAMIGHTCAARVMADSFAPFLGSAEALGAALELDADSQMTAAARSDCLASLGATLLALGGVDCARAALKHVTPLLLIGSSLAGTRLDIVAQRDDAVSELFREMLLDDVAYFDDVFDDYAAWHWRRHIPPKSTRVLLLAMSEAAERHGRALRPLPAHNLSPCTPEGVVHKGALAWWCDIVSWRLVSDNLALHGAPRMLDAVGSSFGPDFLAALVDALWTCPRRTPFQKAAMCARSPRHLIVPAVAAHVAEVASFVNSHPINELMSGQDSGVPEAWVVLERSLSPVTRADVLRCFAALDSERIKAVMAGGHWRLRAGIAAHVPEIREELEAGLFGRSVGAFKGREVERPHVSEFDEARIYIESLGRAVGRTPSDVQLRSLGAFYAFTPQLWATLRHALGSVGDEGWCGSFLDAAAVRLLNSALKSEHLRIVYQQSRDGFHRFDAMDEETPWWLEGGGPSLPDDWDHVVRRCYAMAPQRKSARDRNFDYLPPCPKKRKAATVSELD
jgi:hypothetical protein